jgi:hypothetical protein
MPLVIFGILLFAIGYSIWKRNFPAAIWITLVLIAICYGIYRHLFAS